MAVVVPNVGEIRALEYILNKVPSTGALSVRLYSNDITIDEATVDTDFTEVSGGGYSAKLLTGANWDITPSDPSEAVYNQELIFDFTGSVGLVYGYYVTHSDGTLMWAERFTTGPFDVQVAGSQIRINLRFTAE